VCSSDLTELGDALISQGKFVEAETAAREAIRLNPGKATLYRTLENTLKKVGDLAETTAAYRDCIRVDPKNPDAHCGLAKALAQQASLSQQPSDWDAAATEFTAAIDLSSETVEAGKTNRADICIDLARWDQAFDRVRKLRPNEPALWIGRAHYRALQSRWAEALADCAQGNGSSALLLVLNGDIAGYQKARQRRLAEQPSDSDNVVRGLAAVPLENAADGARLVEWAEQGVKANPDRPWYIHALSLAQYRAGQFEAAIENGKKSNAMNWRNAKKTPKEGPKAQNWLVLATAHFRLGQTAEANDCLATARKIVEDNRPKEPDDAVDMYWADWEEINVLLREAQALINGGDSNPPSEKKDQPATPDTPAASGN